MGHHRIYLVRSASRLPTLIAVDEEFACEPRADYAAVSTTEVESAVLVIIDAMAGTFNAAAIVLVWARTEWLSPIGRAEICLRRGGVNSSCAEP
jgi:hypothetical protein